MKSSTSVDASRAAGFKGDEAAGGKRISTSSVVLPDSFSAREAARGEAGSLKI